MSPSIPRQTAETLIRNIDLGYTKLAEAKRYALDHHRVTLTGRTKDQVVRSIAAHIREGL